MIQSSQKIWKKVDPVGYHSELNRQAEAKKWGLLKGASWEDICKRKSNPAPPPRKFS